MKSSGDRIIFINPTVNSGKHYNETCGEYTCPINGLYFFSFMVQSNAISSSLGKDGPYASLVYNSNLIARAKLLNSNSESILAVLSGSAVINCEAGYKIWVQCTATSRLYSQSDYPGNVFSGFLIAPGSHE